MRGLTIAFGTIESRPRLSDAEYEELLKLNRSRYSAASPGRVLIRQRVNAVDGFEFGRPEVF